MLLLDEPTATLDPRSQSQVIDLIQEWKSTSRTIITATHQLDIVEDIAQSVFIMEAGSVAASGPSEILSNTDLLLQANLAPLTGITMMGSSIRIRICIVTGTRTTTSTERLA